MASTETEAINLPEDRVKTVEAGLALFQQVQAERDNLRSALHEANHVITQQRVEIDSLHQLHNMLESHIQSYMLQRDEAVAQRAAYETLFATIQAQLRVFHLPSTPLVKDVADAIQDREPDRSDLGDPVPVNAGSGQRPATLPHASPSTGEIPRRTPVLAHDKKVLGQHSGWPSLGKQDSSRTPR